MPTVSQETVVRILTIIGTPFAAGFSAWGAKKGLQLPAAEVVTVGALAGVSVLGTAWHWLSKRPTVVRVESKLEDIVEAVHARIAADPALNIAAHDLEGKLEAQTGQITQAIAAAVHAPDDVRKVMEQLAALIDAKAPADGTAAGRMRIERWPDSNVNPAAPALRVEPIPHGAIQVTPAATPPAPMQVTPPPPPTGTGNPPPAPSITTSV